MMKIVRINKFLQEEDNISWLVEDFLPDVGWTLLYGLRGLGKTTFAMQMCEALQTGSSFLGRRTKQTNIVYVQADSAPVEWKAILERVAPSSMAWTIVSVPEYALDNPLYVSQLDGLIHEDPVNAGFLVFDSLYNLTQKKINTEGVLQPVNQMKLLARGKPWLLIHHPRKDGEIYSGHNSLGGNCSNEWSLLKTKLKIEKGRLVRDKEILLTKDGNGLWMLKADEDSYVNDSFMNAEVF